MGELCIGTGQVFEQGYEFEQSMRLIRIDRSAIVLHPAACVFNLVDDIKSYPDYMDGCRSVGIISRSEQEVVARLDLAKAGIRQSFTTRNRLIRPRSIIMSLEDGPFKHFQGEWRFDALTESACKISLQLEFEFKSGIGKLAGSKLFTQVANNLVAATTERADVIAARRQLKKEGYKESI